MLIAERYRLGASLGRGGMGEVFRATDELLGREVAVKLMLRSGGDGTPAAAERFQREARAAARLSDAHIVAVYDFGQDGDNFYLVMELVEGRSVAREVDDDGPLPWERAVEIVEQAAAGLAVAHAENVVHRDIKPSNLMVSADGVVKVADFGIAALPGAETHELTMTGQILGSPYYLSPERARGLKGGPESDVYALGCVLYQLITGRPPFMGDHPTAVLYQHVDAEPVPPSRLRPELAGPLEGLLLQMLAKDPEVRPTAAELTNVRAAADRLAATTPLVAQPIVTPAEPGATRPIATPPSVRPAPKSNKPILISALALLAVAAAVTTGVVLHNTGDRTPPTVDIGPQQTTGTPTTTPTTEPSQTTTTTSRPTHRTTATPSSTPSTTPSTTPTTTPSTPSATPTTTPSSTPTSTPTKTPSSPSPSRTPTSTPPTTSSTPTKSSTPPPANTPTP